MKKLNKRLTDTVEVTLETLCLLCLAVDYKVKDECKEIIESMSCDLQKDFKFDTNEFRQILHKMGVEGAL